MKACVHCFPSCKRKRITKLSTFRRQIMDKMQSKIVVSGMSGRFPESDNVAEFWANLISGVDMVTAENNRWPDGYYNLPPRSGTLKDLTKFDAEFFGLSAKV